MYPNMWKDIGQLVQAHFNMITHLTFTFKNKQAAFDEHAFECDTRLNIVARILGTCKEQLYK